MKKQPLRFVVPFNKRKQSFVVMIWYSIDEFVVVYEEVFKKKYDDETIAFYAEQTDRYTRIGPFGVIHILYSHFTLDTIVHECVHLLVDWMKVRHMQISDRNEERVAYLFDEITRNFWAEHRKAKEARRLAAKKQSGSR